MHLTRRHLLNAAAILTLIISTGCSDRNPTDLPPATGHIDPLVFDDDYGSDVYFQAFFQTHITAVSLDSVYAYGGFAQDGARSLKVNVPPVGSSLGLYSGGVLTAGRGRNMSDFNALTFYARANNPISLDVVGLGNDNTGTSLYEAGRTGVPIASDWTFVVVPIPASGKLLSERGLLTFAEATDARYPDGYDIWFDEISYAHLGNITNPRPFMPSSTKQYFVGSTTKISDTSTTFDIDGADVLVNHMPGYFDFASSDPAIARITADGIQIVGVGGATITAVLDQVPVDGQIVLSGFQAPNEPAVAPDRPAQDVISLYSDVYDDVPVSTWRADWSSRGTDRADFEINGDQMHAYTFPNNGFIGVIFGQKVNASQMGYFHLDVYAPFGTNFTVKLVARDNLDTRPDNSLELTFDATTTPAFAAGGWSSLDIPLTDFTFVGPAPIEDPTAWLAELVLKTADANLVLVDNIYWHN